MKTRSCYRMMIFAGWGLIVIAAALASCQPISNQPPPTITSMPIKTSPIAGTKTTSMHETPISTQTVSPISLPTLTPEPQSNANSFPPLVHSGWTSYTNANFIRAVLIDQNGDLWTGGSGGVVHWDGQTDGYVKYTTEHGLASNYVTSVAQADDGTMWFGTYGSGVSRFDGQRWTTFTTQDGLINNTVLYILAAQDGRLWFGTENGLSSYDGQTWVSYSEETSGDPVGTVEVIAETPDGKLWYGNHLSGLGSYFDGHWQVIENMPENSATALAVSPDGSLWVGGLESIMQWDGRAWKSFPVERQVASIAVSPNGAVWVGYSMMKTLDMSRESLGLSNSSYPGVSRYDGKDWTLVDTTDGLVENEIRTIRVEQNGTIWFGSFSQGVSRYDENGWHTFQTADRQCSNFVDTIDIVQNSIWLGHPSGISYFDGQNWQCYELPEGLHFVFDLNIDQDNGEVWIGTDDGVTVFNGKEWVIYNDEQYPWMDIVHAVASLPDGSQVIGTGVAVYKFDGKTEKFMRGFGKTVNSIQATDSGSLWVGTTGNVYFFDGKDWQQHELKEAPFVSIQALSLDLDQSLWVATCPDGVFQLNKNIWKMYSENEGLAGDCVLSITTSQDGVVWAGSTEGLSKFFGQQWKIYRTKDGLADNYIQDIDTGSDGAIWIATIAGVSRYLP